MKFKLIDTNTGRNISITDHTLDAEDGFVRLHGAPLNHIKACAFTGLQDCDGNDIYEGDVIRDPDDEMDFYLVKFYEGSFLAIGEGAPNEHLLDMVADTGGVRVKGNRWQPEFREVFGDGV